jgi:hypothetical protein
MVQQEFPDQVKGREQHQLRQPCVLVTMGIITTCIHLIVAIAIAAAAAVAQVVVGHHP